MSRKGSSVRALVVCRVLALVTERILRRECCSVMLKNTYSTLYVKCILD